MRTTAVYGSGKFGTADRDIVENRTALSIPFLIEMLNIYLIRVFTVDLVKHAAKMKNEKSAITLDKDIRRKFGIVNSTGLGMAPFLINHPSLLKSWVFFREEAFRKARNLTVVSEQKKFTSYNYYSALKLVFYNGKARMLLNVKKQEFFPQIYLSLRLIFLM